MPFEILHLDASARPGLSGRDPHGSHSRRLSHRFVQGWRAARPDDRITYRDVGQQPPSPISGEWIAAAFTPPDARDATARATLAESDAMVAELIRADLIVIGAPMYNFGIPAQLKAWIDNVVRVGVTFGFDRARGDEATWPMLPPGKRLVTLSSRGGMGFGPDGPLAGMNLVERSLSIPLGYLGVAEVDEIAIEYDEFSDHRLAASVATAEAQVDALVARLVAGQAELRRPALVNA